MIGPLQQIAIVVSDLEESLDFYCGKLGLTKFRQTVAEPSKLFEKICGVPGETIKAAFIRYGDDPKAAWIELLQYDPPGKTQPKDFSYIDIGISHIGFYVTNLDEMYKDLVVKGVKFNAPPQSFDESGPRHDDTKEDRRWRLGIIGRRTTYCRDPDGNSIELAELLE